MFAEHSCAVIGSGNIADDIRQSGWRSVLLMGGALLSFRLDSGAHSLETGDFISVRTTFKFSDEQRSAKPVCHSTSKEPGEYRT